MLADLIRTDIIYHSHRAGSSHIASCLSCADILAVLYGEVIRPEDRFLLGKGHAALAHLSALVRTGRAPVEDLLAFPKYHTWGNQEYMGSLGHAFPIACGVALTGTKSFVLVGDGECEEGTYWEAARFAVERDLPVTVIIDHNHFGGVKRIDRIKVPMVRIDIDGHDPEALKEALSMSGPIAVVCHTVKGKGVSFMENDNAWHYKTLTTEEFDRAFKEVVTCDPNS